MTNMQFVANLTLLTDEGSLRDVGGNPLEDTREGSYGR